MSDSNTTINELAKMPDAAKFERLATAVLRSARPDLYANISHPGVNEDGKTVKAPLDGIGWTRSGGQDRVVSVAHSTHEQKDIHAKWLHNPATVKVRNASGKPTAPEGDLRKAIREINGFRGTQPGLKATFALTTNREPNQESVVSAQQLASANQIDLDIWSASRIAQYLDDTGAGQQIRRRFLGQPVELVSVDLIRDCCEKQLQQFSRMLDPALVIRRMEELVDRADHVFLVGPSGAGKTSIAVTTLREWLARGAIGIIVSGQTVERASMLAEAIDIELRKIEPTLEPNAGLEALKLATSVTPFMVLVEESNAFGATGLILNKIARWSIASGPTKSSGSYDCVRIFCPIWPKNLTLIDKEYLQKIQPQICNVGFYTDAEAQHALMQRAAAASLPPSFDVVNVARALGNDPLLIALHDLKSTPNHATEVHRYVATEVATVALNSTLAVESEIEEALHAVVREMLTQRTLNPTFREVRYWLSSDQRQLDILREFFKHGTVLRLVRRDQEEILVPRHDRVLLVLFSQVMRLDLRQTGALPAYFSDPFFAEAVGMAVEEADLDSSSLAMLIDEMPLGCFHALGISVAARAASKGRIVQAIERALAEGRLNGDRHAATRFEALRILATIDAREVVGLTDYFDTDDHESAWLSARFRNGNVEAGLRLVLLTPIGVTMPGRNELFASAFAKSGKALAGILSSALSHPPAEGQGVQELNEMTIRACLCLAGYLGDAAVGIAIGQRWAHQLPAERDLVTYLWAAARCCGANARELLEPICDAWAALPPSDPNEAVPYGVGSRDSLDLEQLSWEFRSYVPTNAISYLIDRANSDENLRDAITSMLRTFDNPDAVEYVARRLAQTSGDPLAAHLTDFYYVDEWRPRKRNRNPGMSVSSRDRLRTLYQDDQNDEDLREAAFRLWSASKGPRDLALLRTIDEGSPLFKRAVWERAVRRDYSVIPALLTMVDVNPQYWWQAGRYIWSPEMTNSLHRSIVSVMSALPAGDETSADAEWIFQERLMELDEYSAEAILVSGWPLLKHSPRFIQAALHTATEKTAQLAEEAIRASNDPKGIFRYFSLYVRQNLKGRKGITRFVQMEQYCKYLKYMSDDELFVLWGVCNEYDWKNFRESKLDPMLEKSDEWRARLHPPVNFSSLDEMVAGRLIGSGNFWWSENKTDKRTDGDLFELLFQWLETHRTAKAIQVVADILVTHSSRSDFEKMARLASTWPDVEDLIADLRTAVQLRTLH